MKRLGFGELIDLHKKNPQDYKKYMDSLSDRDLVDYFGEILPHLDHTSEFVNVLKDKIVSRFGELDPLTEMNNSLEKYVN